MTQFIGTDNGEILPTLLLSPVLALGNDQIYGLGGNDLLLGWTGDDLLNGGAGADVLIGGVLNVVANLGTVSVSGIDTADYSTSSAGVTVDLSVTQSVLNLNLLGIQLALNNAVTGHGGDAEGDTLVGITNLTGSNSSDNLIGDGANNTLIGLDGNDFIRGGGGADIMDGGAGFDTVSWQPEQAVVVNLINQGLNAGAAAGDVVQNFEAYALSNFADNFTADHRGATVYGFGGDDIIAGGDGNDLIDGGIGADILNGANGFDTVSYAGSVGGVLINVAAGTVIDGTTGQLTGSVDQIANFEQVVGSAFGADLYFGSSGIDYFAGLAGDDYVADGGAGNDVFNGGDGFDTISYYSSAGGTFIDMRSGRADDGQGGTDTIISFEQIYGSNTGADSITGDGRSTIINGFGGNDTIAGLGGSDTLVGGLGNDTFVYFTSDFAPGNIDTIVDFSLTSGNTDRLAFYGVSMSDLTFVESSGNTFISSTTVGGGGIMVMNTSIDALAGHMSFL